MQVSAAFESQNGIFVHAEVAPEISGVNRQAFAMTLGIGIAALYDKPKSAEDGIGGLEFIGELFEAE